MIKFKSLRRLSTEYLGNTLRICSPKTIVNCDPGEEEDTFDVRIITYLPITIGPEDIIIIPPEGDPIVIPKAFFHTMEVF